MGVKGNVNVTGRELTSCQEIFNADVGITCVQYMLNGCFIVVMLNPVCLISLPLSLSAAMQAKLKLADASWQLAAHSAMRWRSESLTAHVGCAAFCQATWALKCILRIVAAVQWANRCSSWLLNVIFLLINQVSKALPAACVGVNHLHTHRPWLQKTGVKAKNNKYNCVLHADSQNPEVICEAVSLYIFIDRILH